MKKFQTYADFQTTVNLPNPDYNESTSDSVVRDKITFRRKRINQLRLRGYTNKEISIIIGSSLSTVEKDLQKINELSRKWFEEESVKEFCQSLHDSIILCDNAVEDLQVLNTEYTDVDSKLKILSKISEFEERKMQLYKKTRAVQKIIHEEIQN